MTIFDNVEDLVANIGDDDTRQPFIVTHRKVDHYVLAEDDVEALATVFAEKSGAAVANVPLNEILKAARAKKKPAAAKKPAAKKSTASDAKTDADADAETKADDKTTAAK